MKPLIVFSRHPSHDSLRRAKLEFKERVCIRFGSETVGKRKYQVEINSPQVAQISGDKLLMKKKFTEAGVKTAKWYIIRPNHRLEMIMCDYDINNFVNENRYNDEFRYYEYDNLNEFTYPIIAKNRWGSRGTGNVKFDEPDELENFIYDKGDDIDNYIFEEFFKRGREYRLHVTKDGCFYTCRKMLKRNAEETWHRHAENCVWMVEDNALFDKPVNWELIVEDCVKALKAIGADVLAFDVKVETTLDKKGNRRNNPEWILIESCSAPSLGVVTLERYIAQIPLIVESKLKNNEV